MKKGTIIYQLILALSLCLGQTLQASHNDDGWIHFEHLPNTQNDYVITVYQVLLQTSDAYSPIVNEIKISDGAQYDTSYHLTLINPPAHLDHYLSPESWWAAGENCSSINGSQQNDANNYFVYRDTIRLPYAGRFTITKLLNPTGDKANTVSNSGSQIISAILDNRFGAVSLPLMSRDMLDRALPEEQWLWKGHIDTSYLAPGDSFSQEFYHGYFLQNGSYTPLAYQPNFSALHPLGLNRSQLLNRTDFPFRFKIDSSGGQFMVVVRMSVKRYSSQSQSWIEVAASEHDFTFFGHDSLSSIVNSIGFEELNAGTLSPRCGDQSIYLKTNSSVYPSSLDLSGSQFWVQGNGGQVYPVTSAQLMGPDSLRLLLLNPLDSNQSYTLQIRPSLNSGQTLQTLCGMNFPLDTLSFTIQDCNGLEIKDESIDLSIYPNPSSGIISIEGANDNSRFEIRNLSGKVVQTGLVQERIKLSLNSGLYLLQVYASSGESLWQEKLIIAN